MNLVELTEFIVKSIVSDVDSVKVEEKKSDKSTTIIITVNEKDTGRIIGRSGKVINSIKTLVQEAASLNKLGFVKVEVNK